jgi:hypothetical protein
MTRRAAPKPARRKGPARGPKADRVIFDEPAALVTDHPGVLAAHDGRVTPGDCAHPASRRDPKNTARCCACSAVGLDPPAKPPARRR